MLCNNCYEDPETCKCGPRSKIGIILEAVATAMILLIIGIAMSLGV